MVENILPTQTTQPTDYFNTLGRIQIEQEILKKS